MSADNTVILEIEYEGSGVKRANTDLDQIEKKAASASTRATQAVENQTRGLLAVVDRRKNDLDRIVSSAEKKAALVGATAAQRIADERDILLRRVSWWTKSPGEQQAR
jgi:hypothetical protein